LEFIQKFGRFFGLLLIVAIIYFFYSSYSDYYQNVRAVESYKHARMTATLTAEYFSKNLKFPDNIDRLDLEKAEPSYAGEISIHKQTGIIKIQLAGKSLDEGIFIFSPTINGRHLSYDCQSFSVPIKYVPNACISKSS
jgi:hypothetical protein